MSDLIKGIIVILYALLVFGFAVYSLVALYSLNLYGKSRTINAFVTLFYTIVSLVIIIWGWNYVQSI